MQTVESKWVADGGGGGRGGAGRRAWGLGRGGLHRDLGDRVKVFCAGAGTNIGQTLGKTGSLWDSWPVIQDWRTKVHYLLSDITAKVLLTHSSRTNMDIPEDNDLWTPRGERWEKQEVVKVTAGPFAWLAATVKAHRSLYIKTAHTRWGVGGTDVVCVHACACLSACVPTCMLVCDAGSEGVILQM